jgi:disulfide bond formation protein DsbB
MDTDTVTLFLALLAVLAMATVAVVVLLAVTAPVLSASARALDGARRLVADQGLALAWLVAAVSMAGSLWLSEGPDYPPCELCWYQRIAMYPLVLVLGVAVVRGDAGAWRYAIPLPVVGALIAAYHVTIQWRPTLDVGVCSAGASCTGRYLNVFGFVSIPVMAGAAFLLITVLLLLVRSIEHADREVDA